ncbi:hypothetical protein ACEPAI_9915 [Sanghuangporus weigelae]
MSDSTEHNWALETFHYEYNKNWPMIIGAALGIILNVIGFRMWRSKCYWPWLAPTAAGLLATGYSARSFAQKKEHILALHIANNVLIVAPAVGLYCIFNYQVWGKLMTAFTTGRGKYSLVKHDLAIRALALADIVSFTAQGGGAGLRATVDHQNTGRIIFLGGVISSNITYGLFVFLVVYSHRAFYLDSKYDKGTFPYLIYVALYLSSACIMFRTGYRFIELIQGNDGKFVTEEKWLYMFDAIPMCIASLVYAVFFPGTLIQKAQDAADYSEIGMAAPRSESRDQLYP